MNLKAEQIQENWNIFISNIESSHHGRTQTETS
jgi:hypothetical protein